MSELLKQEWFLLGQPWCHSEESGMDIYAGDEDPHSGTYLFSTQVIEDDDYDEERSKEIARDIAEHILYLHNSALENANKPTHLWLEKLRAEQGRVEQLRAQLTLSHQENERLREELEQETRKSFDMAKQQNKINGQLTLEVRQLRQELEKARCWQPIETAPNDGSPFLVLLEEPMLNSRVHAATFHPNIRTIGGHFDFDAPKSIGWMPLPPSTTSDIAQTDKPIAGDSPGVG